MNIQLRPTNNVDAALAATERPSSRQPIWIWVLQAFLIQPGAPFPWLNHSNSLAEGVDLTILIALFSAAVLAASLHALASHATVPASITSFTVPSEDRDMPA